MLTMTEPEPRTLQERTTTLVFGYYYFDYHTVVSIIVLTRLRLITVSLFSFWTWQITDQVKITEDLNLEQSLQCKTLWMPQDSVLVPMLVWYPAEPAEGAGGHQPEQSHDELDPPDGFIHLQTLHTRHVQQR